MTTASPSIEWCEHAGCPREQCIECKKEEAMTSETRTLLDELGYLGLALDLDDLEEGSQREQVTELMSASLGVPVRDVLKVATGNKLYCYFSTSTYPWTTTYAWRAHREINEAWTRALDAAAEE